MLLQILDSGHLTDSLGRKVDFKNTILIMTSNLGTREIGSGKSLGFQAIDIHEDYSAMEKKVMTELRKTFNPEFLNRIDDVIVFNSLGKDSILTIIDILLEDIKKRLVEKEMDIRITQNAREFIAKEGYNPSYGARPLRRAIQKLIENPLSEELLQGKFIENSIIQVDFNEDKLTFSDLVNHSKEAEKS
jgi:ATP-dependent Clp protease ATP-binding subunit ClpC